MRFLIAVALAAISAPLHGQEPANPAVEAAVDPARLAISRRVAAQLVPDGVFMKVMSGAIDTMMSGMMDEMLDIPVKDLVRPFVKDSEKLTELGPGTVREINAIIDPAYQQRLELSTKAMFSAMGGIMSMLEPELREGMAIAYANRFTEAELTDMDRFFASPSGTRFAAENMTIMTDPALAKRMQGVMPRLIEALPEIAKKAEEATADLPKPRTISDLSPADRSKLAKLLGIDEKDLKK